MTQPTTPYDEAIEWHIRLAEDDADWDGFTLWLEADPAHRQAYDLISQAEDKLAAYLPDLQAKLPANDDMPVPAYSSVRRWQPIAVSALFAVMMVGGGAFWQMRAPAETLYTTDGAAPRTIALANGAAIKLDRNSEIRVTEGDISKIIVNHGAAFFDAPPDPDPSFDVHIGAYRVSDVGTKFAITREQGTVQVQVAQGMVRVGADAGPLVSLQQGRAVHISENTGQTRVYRINPEVVASWRTGQLTYDNAPISAVMGDLQRHSGLTIKLDPRIADQHFTGVLPIGDGTKLVSDFSSLTGFEAERRGKTIYLRLPR